jgi:aminodeoxyfutalosine deaminase
LVSSPAADGFDNAVVLWCADVVVPITASPIRNGCVAVRGEHIVAVGSQASLRETYLDAAVRAVDGFLLPGLVNAHTHLQFTTFAAMGKTPFVDYTAWSERFVEEYDARPNEDWVAACHAGVELSLAAGVTCIADVVTDFEARDVLFDRSISGVAYLELIGLDLKQWDSGIGAELATAVSSAPTTERTSVGISPHAPYSVEPPVMTAMAVLARELGVRLHSHVAESDGEHEFYQTGTGTLADRVRVVANRPVAILEQGGFAMTAAEVVSSVGLLGTDSHIAHGVYLKHAGRALVAAAGSIVALCPRSNVIVGIDPPPVADYLDENIPFAVGTDSLSSSPSLDPLDDLHLLKKLAIEQGADQHDLDRRLLAAATIGGARAMGLEDQLGSLEVGKRADFAIFDLGPDAGASNIEAALVDEGAGRCVLTIIGGDERWRAHKPRADEGSLYD